MVFLASLFYTIWSFRNERIHSGRKKLEDFVKIFNHRVIEFSRVLEEKPENVKLKVQETWTPPPSEWIKGNIDAAYKDGVAALAMVLRDSNSRVVFLATKLDAASSSLEAEMKAFAWALEMAQSMAWHKIIWSSDAQAMVKEINSNKDPLDWHTRYLTLFCRQILQSKAWILVWNERGSNQLADRAAKITLSKKNNFYFSVDSSLVCSFPSCLLDVTLQDQFANGLLL